MVVGILVYGLHGFTNVYTDQIVSLNKESRWLSLDDRAFNPSEAGFNLAVGFDEKKLDPSIGFWTFNYKLKENKKTKKKESY